MAANPTATTASKAKGSRMLNYLAGGFVLPIIVLVLGNVFFSLMAMLHGDQKRHVTGRPSLESSSMPWYWYWQHELTAHFLLLVILSVGGAALVAYLRGPYPESSLTK